MKCKGSPILFSSLVLALAAMEMICCIFVDASENARQENVDNRCADGATVWLEQPSVADDVFSQEAERRSSDKESLPLDSSKLQAFLAIFPQARIEAESFVSSNPILALLVLAVLVLAFASGIGRKPHATRFQGTADEVVRRKRITKIRSGSRLFTSPYPNGWYCLCRSSDVKPGEVKLGLNRGCWEPAY